jgi:hypothetical protein
MCQAVQNWQGEGGSLASSGLGATLQIATFQDMRNGRGLDGGGNGVAFRNDSPQDGLSQPKVIKSHSWS